MMFGVVRSARMAPHRKGVVRSFGSKVQIILKENVPNLGRASQVVSVKAGYMRNYLYPQRLAVYGTKDLLETHTVEMAAPDAVKMAQDEAMANVRSLIEGITLEFSRESNDESALYGSVTTADVVGAMKDQHEIELTENMLAFPGDNRQALKTLGEHVVQVKLSNQEDAGTVKLRIDIKQADDQKQNPI